MEENHYYPYGLTLSKDAGGLTSGQPYKYNGKELEKHFGLEMYEYGNRNYDPQLGRFAKIDRFAEKYYPLAPYQYAANNPVQYIDVNGDSIYVYADVNGKRTLLYYGEGKAGNTFYYNTSRIDEASGVTINEQHAYEGDNQQVKDVNRALGRISLGEEGQKLVSELANSKDFSFTIVPGNTNSYNEGANRLYWKESNVESIPTEKGMVQNIPFISLSHELGHVQDDLHGTVNYKSWSGIITEAEKYGSHVENKIRGENGYPLRTHYGIQNVETTEGVKKVPDNSTPLLNSKGESLHYDNYKYKK